jgi:hypothetical protein
MKYFNLVLESCLSINQELTFKFKDKDICFLRASLEEIAYRFDNMEIIFNYSPERYDYGKIMLLKDIMVKIDCNSSRMYSINEVISFCRNSFRYYETEFKIYTVKEMVDNLIFFENIIVSSENKSWESKLIEFKRNKFKNYL